jgi:hypothetical protein
LGLSLGKIVTVLGGPKPPQYIGGLARCFFPEVVDFEFHRGVQPFNSKSTNPPTQSEKDKFHNVNFMIDSKNPFVILVAPEGLLLFQRKNDVA